METLKLFVLSFPFSNKTLFRAVFLFSFALSAWCFPGSAYEKIKVKIEETKGGVRFSSNTFVDVRELGSKRLAYRSSGTVFRTGRKRMTLNGRTVKKQTYVVSSKGELKMGKRRYRGVFFVIPDNGGLIVVNEVELGEYLAGVLPAEIHPDWPMETLKAQAVASRSYAIHRMTENARKPWHLYGNVQDQVYLGFRLGNGRVVRAIEETRREILTFQGKVIPAFYHANSGGTTEDSANVWNESLPFIVPLRVPYGRSDPHYDWVLKIPESRMLKALKKLGNPLAFLNGLEIERRTASGRAYDLKIFGNRVKRVKATDLRDALGTSRLKSTKFEVSKRGSHFVFRGQGYGHGVGMCQWCAKEMAEQGFHYRRILASFYRDTKIKRLDSRSQNRISAYFPARR